MTNAFPRRGKLHLELLAAFLTSLLPAKVVNQLVERTRIPKRAALAKQATRWSWLGTKDEGKEFSPHAHPLRPSGSLSTAL
jgi:hypothetical protein